MTIHFCLLLQLKRVSSDLDNLNECRSRQRDQIEAKERHLAEAMERERQAVFSLILIYKTLLCVCMCVHPSLLISKPC